MKKLPKLPRACARRRVTQTAFTGYDHRPSCGEGGIYEMENLSCGDAPLVSTRPGRTKIWTGGAPGGVFASSGGLLWCALGALYHDGAAVGTLTPGQKQFAELSGTVLIWPDKAYYMPATGEFGSAEPTWTGAAALGGAANTLTAAGVDFTALFRAGDAVTLSGCETAANNGTFILRAVSAGALTFYENTFTLAQESEAQAAVTVTRALPPLAHVCAHGNRLWGCAGDQVWCTRLGDPFGWFWYEADETGPVATAAWSVDTGSAGDFSGCAPYRGCVVFTKPDGLWKLYGDRPENFQLLPAALTGAEAASGASFAVADETLLFLSPSGVLAAAGGAPVRVGDRLGRALHGGAAGSDGVRYYLSARDGDNAAHLFVYDTRTRLWSREDGFAAAGFAWHAGALYAQDGAGVWRFGAGDTQALESSLETGDFTPGGAGKARLLRVLLRLEAAPGAQVTAAVQYDSDGVWRTLAAVQAGAKRTFLLPVAPRRCDHFRLRLSGVGAWRLLSLAREEETGSPL